MNKTEHLIVSGLVYNNEFSAKAIDNIKSSYFTDEAAKNAFILIQSGFVEYGRVLSPNELEVEISKLVVEEGLRSEIKQYIEPIENVDIDYLTSTAEEYCRDAAILQAIYESIEIAQGENTKKNKNAIPDLLSDAINFSFENDFGLDYFNDIESRLESYNEEAIKYPFKLAALNELTNGGTEASALSVITAPTGFGKSIHLADEALFSAKRGLNVLYFTFEMSDMRIAKRMDANYFDVDINELPKFKSGLRDRFETQRSAIKKGRLWIKEFGPDCVTALHIKNFIKLIQQKEKIKIDIVYLDYINLMIPAGGSKNDGTYKTIENICKELINHVAKYFKIPVNSATQLNRGGQNNTSPSIENIAESQGLSNTVDLLIVFYDTEELRKAERCAFKALKNRFGEKDVTGLLGLIRAKMKFFDIDPSESKGLVENISTPTETPLSKSPNRPFSNFGGFNKNTGF